VNMPVPTYVETAKVAPVVRTYMERHLLTQAEMAELLSLSRVIVNRILMGHHKRMKAETARQIADKLGVRPEVVGLEPSADEALGGRLEPSRLGAVVGGVALGDSFFPRPDVERSLRAALETSSVVLTGARRMGKTSLLRNLESGGPRGWTFVQMDVQACEDENEFVVELLKAIQGVGDLVTVGMVVTKKIGSQAEGTPPGVDRLHRMLDQAGTPALVEFKAVVAELDWRAVGSACIETLDEVTSNDVAIVIDEFPLFIDRLARAGEGSSQPAAFLSWFRNLRSDKGARHVRFVLAGSLGFDHLLARLGLSHWANDLRRVALPPLGAAEARRFIVELAAGSGLDLPSEVVDAILDAVGVFVPFHLQVVVARLVEQVRDGHPTASEVDRVCTGLLAPSERHLFQHWVTRLEEVARTPAEQRFVLDLLGWAASSEAAFVRRETVTELAEEKGLARFPSQTLAALETDGYLERVSGGGWQFPDGLLRRWWCHWSP